jgi:hypothetical protein
LTVHASYKLGLLSDLHFDPGAVTPRRWIGTYDPVGLAARLEAALTWFEAEDVDAWRRRGPSLRSKSRRLYPRD